VQLHNALPNGGTWLDRLRLARVRLLHRHYQRHPCDLRRHARCRCVPTLRRVSSTTCFNTSAVLDMVARAAVVAAPPVYVYLFTRINPNDRRTPPLEVVLNSYESSTGDVLICGDGGEGAPTTRCQPGQRMIVRAALPLCATVNSTDRTARPPHRRCCIICFDKGDRRGGRL